MATQTPFLNLDKPEYPDSADVSALNNNMDKIDTALKELSQPAEGFDSINVFQVTGVLPDDDTSSVPAAARPCLICSRNGSMALYW